MHISRDVTATIRANMKHHEPIVLVYERHDQDARYKLLGDVSESVAAKYGTGGGNMPIVVEYDGAEDIDGKEVL